MRLAVVGLAALVAVSVMACGGGAQPSGNLEEVDQDQFRFLAEGEFIDSRPIGGSGGAFVVIRDGLPGVVSRADAVVVAEILEIVDVTIPTRPAPPNWPVDEIEDRPVTTYSARVERWVKGKGEDEVLITQFGGVGASGPTFIDGDFLLEPGRRYVVALTDRDNLEMVPGPGEYVKRGLGFGAFEVTDGYVHVLNNPLTQELQEQFGGMPLADFVQVLRGYVANPPPSPTPRPAAAEIGPPPTTSLVVNTVGIDTDVKGTAANTATSLGSLNRCNTLTSGGSLTIDITADAVPPFDSATDTGGITGFQFSLLYDASVVKVAASNHDMLLAANPGSSLVSLGDATPDADGSFLVAVSDFGSSTTPESGSGVLARITLEGVGPGVSELTLTDLAIADVSNARYGINSTSAAEVAVDAACPP